MTIYVLYCLVCKNVLAWGTSKQDAEDTKHSSGQFEVVAQQDKNGNEIKVSREILHDCGIFEVEIPEDMPIDDVVGYIEQNHSDKLI